MSPSQGGLAPVSVSAPPDLPVPIAEADLAPSEVEVVPLSPGAPPKPPALVVEPTATPLLVNIAAPVADPSSPGVRTLQVVRRTKARGKQLYLTALAALTLLATCIVAVLAGNTGMDLLWRVLAVLAGVVLALVLWLVTRPRGMDIYPAGLMILVNGQPVTLPWTEIERIDDDADADAEQGLAIRVVRHDSQTIRVRGSFESPQHAHAVADGLRQELELARQTQTNP